jgi:DNA-binding NarL/FixJ family response regulator
MGAWVGRMSAEGARFRTLDEEFQRMVIIDRQIAIIPGDSILIDAAEAVAYVVNDPGVAAFLARIFERDWERANVWDEPAGGISLTPRQRAILKGLSKGKTLQQLAPQLGIKQRAMGEAIAELKVLFKAKTLFDLACRWKDTQGR